MFAPIPVIKKDPTELVISYVEDFANLGMSYKRDKVIIPLYWITREIANSNHPPHVPRLPPTIWEDVVQRLKRRNPGWDIQWIGGHESEFSIQLEIVFKRA